jgi:hypothetical protein
MGSSHHIHFMELMIRAIPGPRKPRAAALPKGRRIG